MTRPASAFHMLQHLKVEVACGSDRAARHRARGQGPYGGLVEEIGRRGSRRSAHAVIPQEQQGQRLMRLYIRYLQPLECDAAGSPRAARSRRDEYT
eukprot:3827611-Pleurochrysis_carterae.AAC.1